MLPPIHRLKKNREIERVFEEGKGYKEDFLYLKLAQNGLKASRFAFIVSRKVAKKAVPRNKIKRRLRGTVRTRLPKIKAGFDGVFVVQRGLETKNPEELGKIVDRLFKKAKLI